MPHNEDIPQGKVKGTIPYIVRGISKVDFHGSFGTDATDSAGDEKSHSFTLSINPRDPAAPVINMAAYSSIELEPWRLILEDALSISYQDLPETEQKRADVQIADAKIRKYAL